MENVRGGSGGDTIVGDAQKNVLVGGGGVDTIDAGAGDDEIDSNDDKADSDTCGDGADKVVRDDLDTLPPTARRLAVRPPTRPRTRPPVRPPGRPARPPTGPTTPTTPTTPTEPTNPPVVRSTGRRRSASLSMGAGLHLGKLLTGGLKVKVKSNESGKLTRDADRRVERRRGCSSGTGVKEAVLASGRGQRDREAPPRR